MLFVIYKWANLTYWSPLIFMSKAPEPATGEEFLTFSSCRRSGSSPATQVWKIQDGAIVELQKVLAQQSWFLIRWCPFLSHSVIISSGEYSVNDSCAKCHTSCDTCSDGSETSCLSCTSLMFLQGSRCVPECSPGYYVDINGCSPCLHTCDECISRHNCSKCRSPLLLQSGECRTTCASGYAYFLKEYLPAF